MCEVMTFADQLQAYNLPKLGEEKEEKKKFAQTTHHTRQFSKCKRVINIIIYLHFKITEIIFSNTTFLTVFIGKEGIFL